MANPQHLLIGNKSEGSENKVGQLCDAIRIVDDCTILVRISESVVID